MSNIDVTRIGYKKMSSLRYLIQLSYLHSLSEKMCDYRQAVYRCRHSIYMVKAFWVAYQSTHKMCPLMVVEWLVSFIVTGEDYHANIMKGIRRTQNVI